jgi:hypothetical protein
VTLGHFGMQNSKKHWYEKKCMIEVTWNLRSYDNSKCRKVFIVLFGCNIEKKNPEITKKIEIDTKESFYKVLASFSSKLLWFHTSHAYQSKGIS